MGSLASDDVVPAFLLHSTHVRAARPCAVVRSLGASVVAAFHFKLSLAILHSIVDLKVILFLVDHSLVNQVVIELGIEHKIVICAAKLLT